MMWERMENSERKTVIVSLIFRVYLFFLYNSAHFRGI